jgi:SAM-dependent methyltransferase
MEKKTCEEIIKAQKDNSLTVNYNKWVFDNICPYIGNKVMDVGSGSGNFLGYLLGRESVVNIDILDVFLDSLKHSYSSYKNVHIFQCDIQDHRVIDIGRQFDIDTVICNNVLEHVQDDLKALSNINDILSSKGNLILVLPAFQCLYSKWDKSIGHFRRYNHKQIKDKLAKTNFSIKVSFYMNIVGFFGWFLNGKILGYTPTKSSLVEKQAVFFDRYIVKPLRRMENMFRPPFGQSLIIIASPIKS